MMPIVRTLKEAINAYYRNSEAILWAERQDGTGKQISSLKEAKTFFLYLN